MPDFLYRFRPLERVLGKGELVNQEIFFSAPDQFNDPIEGQLNCFWVGDPIAWKNLFKRYVFCLE